MIRSLIVFALLSLSTLASGQDDAGSSITVEGEVLRTLKLTPKDLAKFPQSEVKAKDREGKEHTFKGTTLSVVLDSAGVTLGADLKGKNLTKFVLLHAADGYEVVFALAELDPAFTSNTILLATHVDGKPLPKGEGPIRLVNPAEKKPTRWIREISSIKILFSKG